MKTCLISFDLHHPPHTYSVLNDRLRTLSFERLQTHLWAAAGDFNSHHIKAEVVPCLHPGDGLFVFSHESDDDYATHNPVR